MPSINSIPKIDEGTIIHQLREPVSVQLQGVFFAQVRERRKALLKQEVHAKDEGELINRIEHLLSSTKPHSANRLRPFFVHLACCSSIKALRFAERLSQQSEGEIRELALLSELELRMQVYEELTEQPQALLASGLGGDGELIRINGVAIQRHFSPWEAYQQKLLHEELVYLCQEQGGYLEEELWGEEYYGFRLMLPYYINIAELIGQYLNTCNEYGQFLHPDCHVTNMLLLKHEHIQELVNMRKKKSIKPSFGTDLDDILQQILNGSQEDNGGDLGEEDNDDTY